jgi:hypothetical protein
MQHTLAIAPLGLVTTSEQNGDPATATCAWASYATAAV